MVSDSADDRGPRSQREGSSSEVCRKKRRRSYGKVCSVLAREIFAVLLKSMTREGGVKESKGISYFGRVSIESYNC